MITVLMGAPGAGKDQALLAKSLGGKRFRLVTLYGNKRLRHTLGKEIRGYVQWRVVSDGKLLRVSQN